MTSTPRPPAERTAAPGRNRVAIKPLGGVGGHYRSYEVYQRQRVQEATPLINARVFLSKEFLRDPYPFLAVLRDNYPFYRDWSQNADWVVLYNDVTSVFQDEANFETRPKLWYYHAEGFGRDFRDELPVLWAWARGVERAAPVVAERLVVNLKSRGGGDLVADFAGLLDVQVLAAALALPPADHAAFALHYRTMMDGWHFNPSREVAGRQAMAALGGLIRPLFAERRANPGDDIISAIATLEPKDGDPTTPEDVAATLLEGDDATLRGGLANMWFQLLTHPDQLDFVRQEEERMVKRAWQETLRHSTPVLHAKRYARQEVERFGRLIPEGGLVICSAAAGNRDDRIFSDPETFNVDRRDLCYREPRGQYRADGLPAGITLGMGRPSRHPAIPEDRPRSLYAITLEVAVNASRQLLAELPGLRLAPGASPTLFSRWANDIHTCWELPVEFDR